MRFYFDIDDKVLEPVHKAFIKFKHNNDVPEFTDCGIVPLTDIVKGHMNEIVRCVVSTLANKAAKEGE